MTRTEVLDRIGSVIREVAKLPHTRFSEAITFKELKLDRDAMIDVAMGCELAFGLSETHGELRWKTMKDVADDVCQEMGVE